MQRKRCIKQNDIDKMKSIRNKTKHIIDGAGSSTPQVQINMTEHLRNEVPM